MADLDTDALQRLAQTHESKVIQDQKNERRALNQGFSKRATVYFKNNEDSQYHVDSESTKVLIERCNNCKFKINSRILTQTVEVWHCHDIDIMINKPVATLQLDMCSNITVHFTSKSLFSTVVWAGMHKFKLIVGEDEESGDVLESGVEQVENEVNDLQENFDQFIVRYVDGKLTQELVVRLKNGFPTTDREADAFEERQKKNEEILEKHIKEFIDSAFVESKLEKVTRDPEVAKEASPNTDNQDNKEQDE